MKSMYLIQTGLLLTSMTISAVLVLATAGNTVRQERMQAVEQASAMAEKEPVGYILKIYENKIALFRENSETPYWISEIEAYLLPDVDREALEQGIFADSEEELKKYLDDWE